MNMFKTKAIAAAVFLSLSISAQTSLDLGRDSLRASLLTGTEQTQNTPPLKSETYIQYGSTYVNAMERNRYNNYLLADDASQMASAVQVGDAFPTIEYNYLISRGVTNSPDEVGVVYYVFFSTTQCQIVKWNTKENKLIARSEPFSCVKIGLIADFASGGSEFLSNLYKGVLSGDHVTDVRRNEVFQSLVDINLMDYNGDGTQDLFITFGRTMRIYDGRTLEQLLWPTLVATYTNISSSSVVADFNGDNIDDYLSVYAYLPQGGGTSLTMGGYMLKSELQDDGTVTYKEVRKDIDATDFSAALTSKRVTSKRAMISMRLIYPDGKSGAPKLAVAVNKINYDDETGETGGGYVNGYTEATFDNQLTVVDFFTNAADEAKGWYSVAGKARKTQRCYYWNSSAITSIRTRPYLFGKPALAAASTDGFERPQQIFWVDSVYNYNSSSRTFAAAYGIENQHKGNAKGFDRVVGGQIEAVTKTEVSDTIIGREAFVFVLADSEAKSGTLCEDWRDTDYKLATLFKDAKTSKWGIVVDQNYMLNGTNQTIIYGPGGRGSSITSRMTPSLAVINRDKGMRVRLVSTEVTTTTPIINHVLCAPPMKGGKMSFEADASQSSTSQMTTSSSAGFSLDGSLDIAGVVKISTKRSIDHSETLSKATSYRATTGTALTTTPDGQDYVVFNYYVVDKFNYVVDSCEAAPQLVGKTLSVLKVQDSGLRQTDLPVSKFNQMVAGSSCPQIVDSIVGHTTGDYSTYPHITGGDAEVNKVFGVNPDDDVVIKSAVQNRSYSTNTLLLKLGETYSTSTGKSISTSTSGTISASFGLSEIYSCGTSISTSSGKSESWSQTTSYSKDYVLGGILPPLEGDEVDRHTYRMVYYRRNIVNPDGTNNSFMVANWCFYPDLTAESDGVQTVETASPVTSIAYYSPDGVRRSAPAPGLNIKVVTYADGSRSVVKIVEK